MLNANLVFGDGSYLIHYINQCAAAGSIYSSIGGSAGYHYKPISTEDLTVAVEYALTHHADVKGHRFQVNGKDDATLRDILH